MTKSRNQARKAKKRKRSENGNNNGKNDGGSKKTKNGKHPPNHKKHNNNSSSSTDRSANLAAIFGRVADRREKEVRALEPVLIVSLLRDIRELTGIEFTSLAAVGSSPNTTINANKASHEVRAFLAGQYQTINDDDVLPHKRRESWEIVHKIFRLIDTLTGAETEIRAHNNTTNTSRRETANGTGSRKSTGETTQSSSNGKTAAANAADAANPAAAPTLATICADVNNTAKKSASGTSGKKASSSEPIAQNQKLLSTGEKSPTRDKTRSPVRSVASLSSASAQTTATAISSKDPIGNTNSHSNKDPPAMPSLSHPPSVPTNSAPPPYQRYSETTQQHRREKANPHPQRNHNDSAHPPTRDQNSNKTQSSTTTIARKSNDSTVSRNASANTSSNNNIGALLSAGASAAASAAALTSAMRGTAVVSASSSSLSIDSSSSANVNSNSNKTSNSGPSLTVNIEPPMPEVIEQPIVSKTITTVTLQADDSINKPTAYGCFVENRPHVHLLFNQYDLTSNTKKQFLKRLGRWDPYWITEHQFCLGMTAPVQQSKYRQKTPKYSPNTAARFKFRDLVKLAGPRISNISHNQAPKDGELRVLIRMIPLDLSKQKGGGKDRADVHLWPKGTYLQIHLDSDSNTNPCPQVLYQRKQQSHDHSKWLGICKHLDITSMVHKAWSSTEASLKRVSGYSTIELGCFDPQLYLFSLVLCRYRSPASLLKVLTNSQLLRRASYQEMHLRAKKMMESNEVVLDDSDDEHEDKNKPKQLKSIRFSIRDPISMSVLKIPVRGKCCLHFSCFELSSFLEVNKSPSGQRWKCGYCENFLSYVDLERCTLTEQAIQRYGNMMENLRHMVEYREDQTLVHCQPVKSHQERALARKQAEAAEKAANSGANAGGNEVVELLDSDSD